MILSGQPLTGPAGLESWHPRDLDTLEEHYQDMHAEQRLAAARQALRQQMGG